MPGQFLHLALDDYDPSLHWPESRVFSIASPPENRTALRITVSQVGVFTERMMGLAPGAEVWLKLPFGEFNISDEDARGVVFVAGGTGVTPFISALSSAADHLKGPVRVLYGARTAELLVYREVMERAAERSVDFSWQAFLESGAEAVAGAVAGQLTVDAVLQARRACGLHARVFLAGPPAMLTSLRGELLRAGMRAEDILVDAWD